MDQLVDTTESRKRYLRRWAALKNERSSWLSHWQEISDYIAPRRGRFLVTDGNKGRKRNTKIIDSTGILALRILASGMMSGLTNPARPWFRLGTPDPEMMEFGPVKDWLGTVEKILYAIFGASNFYNQIHTVYSELGAFGTAALYREPDFENVVRFRAFTAGEYAIAEGESGKVDTLYREFEMTSGQLVEKFGLPNVSTAVSGAYERGDYDTRHTVMHAIEPRRNRDQKKRDGRNMAFASVYLEPGGDKMLSESGYKTFPAYVPRWDVLGGDDYGRSPGMDALGDVKQLQVQERRKSEAIDKMSNPPVTLPSALKSQPASALPGGVTYVNPNEAASAKALYDVRVDIAHLSADNEAVRGRINSIFFADLFLMLAQLEGVQPRGVMELAERKEEKLIQLGPVLQRLNNELFDPLIDDIFAMAFEAGILPPPPEDLLGADLKIEYVSMLAQAMQAVGVQSIERTLDFVIRNAQAFPEMLLKVDSEQAVDEFANAVGAPSRIIRSDDDVAKIKEQQAQAQAQAEQMAGMMQMAETAKTMSETDTENTNALTEIAGALG